MAGTGIKVPKKPSFTVNPPWKRKTGPPQVPGGSSKFNGGKPPATGQGSKKKYPPGVGDGSGWMSH